jgi:FixJ family two-component response regulator
VANVPLVSVVDDNPSVREATVSLLNAHGYATAAFASAEEFLRSGLLDDTFCLVTDVYMHGLGGVELQRHLHEAGYLLPVILMTAYPKEHLRAAAMQAGALGVLTKPVSEEQLIGYVESARRRLGAEGIGK